MSEEIIIKDAKVLDEIRKYKVKFITYDNKDVKLYFKEKILKIQCLLDEIREQLKLERKIALSLNKPYTINVIDNLLDKVKE